ncbi:hypothetical protein BACFIN_05965 [Bacteroides finegoldii DSM 17565]|nr:hypothetical protein BACFIN_05965 [Bacteroides finegoldii DSM 17565]
MHDVPSFLFITIQLCSFSFLLFIVCAIYFIIISLTLYKLQYKFSN